jgi:hypothetical protein
VPGAFAVLPAVVIARVTDVMRAAWLLVSARWSRCICCCVGALRSALRQAVIAALDGVAELVELVEFVLFVLFVLFVAVVVVVVVSVGVAVLVGVGLPVGAVVFDGVAEVVGEGTEGDDAEGKNGAHRARAAEACWRSAVMAFWALVTRCWACARLWFVPAPEAPEALATRGVVVVVGTGVVRAVAAVPFEPLALPEPLAVLVAVVAALWSDSRLALALAKFAFAAVTALLSGAGSRPARVCPALTVSPTATETLETVPVTAKLRLTWLTRWADPVRSRRCSTEPVLTVVVR